MIAEFVYCFLYVGFFHFLIVFVFFASLEAIDNLDAKRKE